MSRARREIGGMRMFEGEHRKVLKAKEAAKRVERVEGLTGRCPFKALRYKAKRDAKDCRFVGVVDEKKRPRCRCTWATCKGACPAPNMTQ